MVKHERQDLRKLLEIFSIDYFPRIFSQLNPQRKKKRYIFPYLGSEDSRHILALKMMAMYGLKKKTTSEELMKDFYRMSQKKKLFIAYNLSHELKIASLAASIAMNKQESNVYEIGPCFGFSSLHYSRLIKEKNINSKPINKLTAIERNKEFLERAKVIKEITGDYTGEIEYIHGDGIGYLRNSVKKGDIIFLSIGTPFMVDGVLGLSNLKAINFVVSYSETTNDKIKEMRGEIFEDLVDSNTYDVFPFADNEHNTHVPWITGKIGVVALSMSI